MIKPVNNNIGKTIVPAVLFLFISIIAGYPASTVKKDNNEYTYTLSPAGGDKPGEYSYTRRELESFLCASVENYIRADEVYRDSAADHHFVKAKRGVIENQKKAAENHEINKWFEDKVTVTSRGNLTVVDIDTTKTFLEKINDIIGLEKFVYKPRLKAANIVVEIAPPHNSLIPSGTETGDMKVYSNMGEASLLKDNLRVRLSINNTEIQMDTYNAGSGTLIQAPGKIQLTPDEMEFRKNNRIVKIYLENILDPGVRRRSITHELLHTIGFTGHSPYYDSNLFPLPVEAYNDPIFNGTTKPPIITPLAERMVEMLYRPEILPGMTVKEAADVLIHLKQKDKTTTDEIISYLLNRRTVLQERKKKLLDRGTRNFDQSSSLPIAPDKWVSKEAYLLEELQEIKTDNKLDPKIIKEIKEAKPLVVKLTRIRRELILLENRKRKLSALAAETGTGKKAWNLRRQIKNCKEEIVVLTDIFKVAKEIAAGERKIENTPALQTKTQIENKLRRILRQLLCIEKELAALSQLNLHTLLPWEKL